MFVFMSHNNKNGHSCIAGDLLRDGDLPQFSIPKGYTTKFDLL